MIIGCGGSGKSTLAIELGKRLSLPVYHLDRLNWQPGWVSMPHSEWMKVEQDLVRAEKWIIDGNYSSTMDIRLAACDTVIFLDMPRTVCLWNILKRWVTYHGRTRPDMTEGCDERIDMEFLAWIWNYNRTKRPRIIARLSGVDQVKQVVILKSHKQVKHFLNSFMPHP